MLPFQQRREWVKGVCDSRESRDIGESQFTCEQPLPAKWDLSKIKGVAFILGHEVTPQGSSLSSSLTGIFSMLFRHLGLKCGFKIALASLELISRACKRLKMIC